jgi:hypothetical protein
MTPVTIGLKSFDGNDRMQTLFKGLKKINWSFERRK